MKILVIDDSKSIQLLVSRRLKNRGMEIVGMGSDGNEGINLFKTTSPDLVLLDITMPNKDGRECLREILELSPHAKIVMLSALSTPEIIAECLNLGAIDYIDKNSLMIGNELEEKIEEIISNLNIKAS